MINKVKFYGTNIYYEEKGELVYWREEKDFCNRPNTKELFNKFLEYEYQEVEALKIKDFSKMKKTKIWNKDGKYLGIEKGTDRLLFYIKIDYRIIKEHEWDAPAVFYMPKLDLGLLEWVADCKSSEGVNFAIANIIYKNCNTPKIEMDIDTLAWIVKIYKNYIDKLK